MTKCVAGITALVAIAVPLAGAMAQALSSTLVFEGNTTAATTGVRIAVQSWGIAGQEHELPLSGFYIAHLLSGAISTTIDGQTTERLPGDYWTVKASAVMRVKVVGEVAVLETIVVSKQ
jgi:quercetin dioxygenase-like cupin family protein